MKDPCDVVKGLLRTEKGGRLLILNQYLFWVDTTANKIENKQGKTSDWKKAIVTLKEGSKIDVA